MPNHLASASSPYLLQHANNPVEWYPWGPEALERARREDKPILLSIGYAACHWCHVMEHESFENAAIAALMNDLFVNIKVDREERPDLDAVYMQAVQAMTGHGGWPMTMFLLPTGEPYYGGTYFPPSDRQGMPGFPRILQALATAYREDRAKVEETGRRVREIYASASRAPENGQVLTAAHLARTFRGLARQFDETFAGFGGAPKFPPTMSLDFLLRHWARQDVPEALDMVHRTFLAMARGGLCDQVGGGIHRYSVDERWLVPHFEKMLYDNALFIRLGAHLWQATHDDEVRRVTMAAVQWVAREMTSTEGGFFSSLDADSEGHEGTFYLWDASELDRTLGADAPLVKSAWGVTPGGNFEGRNILHLPAAPAALAARHGVTPGALSEALDRARAALYPVRAARVWPATDDKVLAGWNGLMIRALCAVVEAFADPSARALALDAGTFLRCHLVRDHRVLRSWRQGRVLSVGFLEDAAATGLAFLDLFSMTGDASWLHDARAITTRMIDEFRDPESGLFFDTPMGHEELLTRPRDITDNAIPSGSSLAAELLARLAVHDSEVPGAASGTPAPAPSGFEQMARAVVDGLAESIARHPLAFGHLAGVADQLAYGAVEVAIPGVGTDIEQVLCGVYVPSLVLARDHGAGALTRGKAPGRAYVCRRYLCDTPTENPSEFAEQLRSARRAAGG